MTGHEYTVQTSDAPASEDVKKEMKKKRRERIKLFWKNVFTKRLGIKAFAIVLAFVVVILLNIGGTAL